MTTEYQIDFYNTAYNKWERYAPFSNPYSTQDYSDALEILKILRERKPEVKWRVLMVQWTEEVLND